MQVTKAVIQGTKVLVFNEVGNLIETVNATPAYLAKKYGYEVKQHQWEEEISEQWYHQGKPIAEPDWDQVRKDLCKDMTTRWSYEET